MKLNRIFVCLRLIGKVIRFLDSQLFLIFAVVFLDICFRNTYVSYRCSLCRLYEISNQVAASSIVSAILGIAMLGMYSFEHVFNGKGRINSYIKRIIKRVVGREEKTL